MDSMIRCWSYPWNLAAICCQTFWYFALIVVWSAASQISHDPPTDLYPSPCMLMTTYMPCP